MLLRDIFIKDYADRIVFVALNFVTHWSTTCGWCHMNFNTCVVKYLFLQVLLSRWNIYKIMPEAYDSVVSFRYGPCFYRSASSFSCLLTSVSTGGGTSWHWSMQINCLYVYVANYTSHLPIALQPHKCHTLYWPVKGLLQLPQDWRSEVWMTILKLPAFWSMETATGGCGSVACMYLRI